MPTEPSELWLLRHGQSLGNVVRDAAVGTGVEVLDIADRDMDVPLSDLGREQSASFGRWMRTQPRHSLPDVAVASPYVRAIETARIALDEAGMADVAVHLDERLREREFGVLDLLTRQGIAARFPDELARRDRLGKFYHRPPGGESWVDVALRLRSLRDSLAREHTGRKVLLVTHEVVIVVWRYLLEDLDEDATLALIRDERLANCSLTTYVTDRDDRLTLDLDRWTAPLEADATEVTTAPDPPVASR